MNTARRTLSIAAVCCLIGLAGCEQKITQANYDKVNNGMNMAQVENLLGKGEDQTASGVGISYGGVAESKKSPETTMVWKGKSMTVTIVFKDGKVVQKSKTD